MPSEYVNRRDEDTCAPRTTEDAIWAMTDLDQVAIGRLRRAAMRRGMPLHAFVDALLQEHDTPTPLPSEAATAIVSEVKGLLEKLASDLPSQMAINLSQALQNSDLRNPQRTAGAGPIGLSPGLEVMVPERRKVGCYRKRRGKAPRVQL